MFQVLKKMSVLLGNEKKKLPIMVLLFLLLSSMDIIGVGLMVPLTHFLLFGEFDVELPEPLQSSPLFDSGVEISLPLMAALVFCVFLARFGLVIFTTMAISKFAQRQRVILATKLLSSYLKQDFPSYLQRNEGDRINRLNVMVTHYVSLTQALLKFVSDTCITGVILALLIFINPLVFCFSAFGFLIFLGSYSIAFRDTIVELGKKANQSISKSMQISQEALRGYKEINLLKKVEFFISQYQRQLIDLMHFSVSIDVHRIMPKNMIEILIISFLMASILFIEFGIASKEEAVITLTVFAFAALRLLPLFSSLAQTSVQLRSSSNSIEQLYDDLLSSPKEPVHRAESQKNQENFHSLTLRGIRFSYSNSNIDLLSNFSLDLKKGDFLGVYGPSGVGKTTLINIIVGLLRPSAGQILVNGKRIGGQSISSLLKIAYLPQETFTLNGTLAENVVLGDECDPKTLVEVEDALALANLGELYKNLPRGMKSQIGELGGWLSGGQKQRLSIARAVYRDLDFFIFDEATNALDVDVEENVIKNLINSGKMKSGIIVSHRRSTLKFCNRILVIDGKKYEMVKNIDAFVGRGLN